VPVVGPIWAQSCNGPKTSAGTAYAISPFVLLQKKISPFVAKKKKPPSLLSPLLVALPVALSPRAATGWPPPLPPYTRFPGLRRVICGDEHPPGTGTPSLPFLLCGTEHPNPNLTCLYSDLIWVRVYKCPVYTCILTSIFMQLFGLYMSTLMSFYLVRLWP
jgi:hypothetical protein